MGLGSFVKSAVKKVGGAVNKVDPTGITGTMLGVPGGAAGKLLSKGLGGKGGGGGTAAPTRKRYQRKKRMRYVSKKRKAFNASNKAKSSKRRGKLSNLGKMLSTGLTKRNTNSLRGRNAGTSSRDKKGKQIGSLAKRAMTKAAGRY